MPVTIDEVSTPDASPTSAPYRISTQGGADVATVKFTPSAQISRWELRKDGADQNTGTLLKSAGRLQAGRVKCGVGKKVSAVTYLTQQTVTIAVSELAGATEGGNSVNIWQHLTDGAWS